MGMAASQARFLGLTARKNNVEYEGQQINQQRTALGNQSANYYNDLLGMAVPVPPSVQDYTKTVYSFEDGNLTNNITSLIAQNNGEYKVSYVSSWQNDFTPVSNGAAVIFKDKSSSVPIFKVGNQTLRTLGTTNDAIGGNETQGTSDLNVTNKTFGLSPARNLTDYIFAGKDSSSNVYESLKLVYNNDTEKYEFYDMKTNKTFSNINDITIITDASNINSNWSIQFRYTSGGAFGVESGGSTHSSGTVAANFDRAKVAVNHDIENDPYLSTLTPQQLTKTLQQEQEYIDILRNKYGADTNWYVRYVENTTTGVYEPIFYNENIVANAQYDENQTGASQSNIPSYKIGAAQETEEVKGVDARLEKDATGRYINITLLQNGNELTYSLTTSTITDQDAYNDAMNQYEFDKAKYDQAIQEINAKIEIVQAEDKSLELRLKQLDTEQDAISTEMDAVQKVIEKNTESTFKTFG